MRWLVLQVDALPNIIKYFCSEIFIERHFKKDNTGLLPLSF